MQKLMKRTNGPINFRAGHFGISNLLKNQEVNEKVSGRKPLKKLKKVIIKKEFIVHSLPESAPTSNWLEVQLYLRVCIATICHFPGPQE